MYAERLPPHDVDAEEAVVGSLLIDGESITRVSSFLKPLDFYREKNRWCYEACLSLFDRSEGMNQVTVAHELSSEGHLEGLGGPSYLSHLVSIVPTSVHIEYYGRIVHRTSILRQLIRAAGDIAAIGYEAGTDVEAALSKAEEQLFRIRTGQGTRDFLHIRDVMDQYMEQSAIIQGGLLERGVAPIPTGFVDIDRLLGGLQRSDMIILAARPSLGKSSLAITMARNAAGQGAIVGFFSLEMGREQLVLRLLASEAGVDTNRLRLGLSSEPEERRIVDAIGLLSDLPIYIDDTSLQGVVEMRGKARRLQMERGLDLLIVDYIQLMRGNGRGDNRVQEMSEISRSLKGLARDLDVPMLAVSQLSRAIETRPSHRPLLSDLRDSGSIEQDADVVAFIHREDKNYTEDEWEHHSPDRPYPKNIADIIFAKHRHGPTATVQLYFRDNLARFENMATHRELG